MPEKMQIVAIADPDEEKRACVQARYHVPPENCFAQDEEMFAQKKLADVAFICTQDRQHTAHAVAALDKGYHLLLEKPIAVEIQDVKAIQAAADRSGLHVVVCHVLRYAPFFEEIRASIKRGDVGDVVCIQALENVRYWHQAHSYVRGNWRSEKQSAFMLLAKCCHDIDYLVWLCGGVRCKRVSSFGSLRHFKPECAPQGAAQRCVDCPAEVKEACPYDAENIYLTHADTGVLAGNTDWPCSILALHPDEKSIREALSVGPYGRCVYHCDNDVVDNQIVNMEMEDGTHCQLMMAAFTARGGRSIRVLGTHGTIEGDMDENIIRIEPFGKPERVINLAQQGSDPAGHGGGDLRMVDELIRMLHEGGMPCGRMTTLEASAESHYIAFAAVWLLRLLTFVDNTTMNGPTGMFRPVVCA